MRLRNCVSVVVSVSLSATAWAQSPQKAQPDIRTGIYRGQPVTFQVINGWAVVDGDIILGRADELQGTAGATKGGPRYSVSIPPAATSLWPKVGNVYQVPYTNDNKSKSADGAVTRFNATFPNVIQFVARTTEPDYVQFQIADDASSGCSSSSNVGRVGGAQTIQGGGGVDVCVPVLMHEMGHAIGFDHEQVRSDRDSFVQIFFDNVDLTKRNNYDRTSSNIDIGLYDLGSTMHYGATTLAADSNVAAMVSIPVGIPFKEGGGYSVGDIDSFGRLYGSFPMTVTITSNPPGLQLTVDDQVVTTGTPNATFTWALNSQHTLDVPANLLTQAVNGTNYVFGRWNDVTPDQPVRHTITVTPGDGSAVYPVASPRITVYSAAFIQMIPSAGTIVTAVSPDASGSVALSPDPTTVSGTLSYSLLQPVTAQANPAAGFNFYDWQFDAASPMVSGLNPYVVRPGLAVYSNTGGAIPRNLTARFAKNPVTTIATDPPGIAFTSDGQPYRGPKNFALDYDAPWTMGSSHPIAVTTPLPSNSADKNARLAFVKWSDGGDLAHNITAGATNATYTASFAYQFPLNISMPGLSTANCAGTIAVTPASADTFYNAGTQVTLAAQLNPGWTLIQWKGSLTGNASPSTLTMDGSKSVQAIVNTTPATDPLAITSVAPAGAAVNAAALVLTVNGTGFVNNTMFCFFDDQGSASSTNCGTATLVTPNQVTVPVPQNLSARAQTMSLMLSNSPDMQCTVTASTPFPVR